MYNFKLTKNEQAVAQFIVLEAITENYWNIEFSPLKIWTDLKMEFAIYDEKAQNKLTTKYRNILEGKYKQIVPSEGKYIKVKRLNKETFKIITDTEEYELKIYLDNKYLVIKKELL